MELIQVQEHAVNMHAPSRCVHWQSTLTICMLKANFTIMKDLSSADPAHTAGVRPANNYHLEALHVRENAVSILIVSRSSLLCCFTIVLLHIDPL